MLLLTLLCFLPTSVSYRYLPERLTLPYDVYSGLKLDPVTIIQLFPHHVLIVYGSKYCSGSLIYSKIVVTAASCFIKNRGEPVHVKVGANTMTGYGQVIPVAEYKIHEYFKELSSLDNDIALLVLQKNVKYGKLVKKTILVEPEVAVRASVPVVITGWGNTNMADKYVNTLIQLEAVVLKESDCKHYRNFITSSNFCVRYTSELILSDNGGGAVFDDLLVGILSIGLTKAHRANFAILTNVSYFHRWITLNSKRFLKKYCTPQNDSYIKIKSSDET